MSNGKVWAATWATVMFYIAAFSALLRGCGDFAFGLSLGFAAGSIVTLVRVLDDD